MACTVFGLRRFRPDWRLPGLVVLSIFYLLPALQTGYYSEDCSHSVGTVGRLNLGINDSLLGVMVQNVGGSMELGRFFPLTTALIDLVFYLIRDVVMYKAYLVTVTVLDLVLFYYLIRGLSGNPDLACFAGCLTVALFQFRVSVDPLLAYYGQMQLVIACVFLSLMALEAYLDGRGPGWLAASAAAYLLCTLTYEVTYTFFLLHLLMIARARRGWLARLKPALPFLGIVCICALTTVVVQRLYPSDLYVHKMSLAPGPFLKAMARQASTALPLSYFLADPHQTFARVRSIGSLCGWAAEPRTISMALGAFLLCHRCLRRRTAVGQLPPGVGPLLVVVAIMLIVLPVLLIASSPFHQQQFSFGVGWIVVLIECYGVGLLLATRIWQRLGGDRQGSRTGWKSVIVSTVVAVLMGVTYRANLEVAACFSAPPGDRHYNQFAAINGASHQQQRLNLESALDAGLMDDVPAGSKLQLANIYPLWHDDLHGVFFYAKHTGKFYLIGGRSVVLPLTTRTYRIRDVSLGKHSGYVVLSRVATANSGTGQEFKLYVHRPGLQTAATSPGFWIESDGSPIPRHSMAATIARASPEVSLIRAGRDWGLFEVRITDDRIAADSMKLVFDTVAVERQRRSITVKPPRIGEIGRLRR